MQRLRGSIGSLAEKTVIGQGKVEKVIGLATKYDYGVTSLGFYNAVGCDLN